MSKKRTVWVVSGIDLHLDGRLYRDGSEIELDDEPSPRLARWLRPVERSTRRAAGNDKAEAAASASDEPAAPATDPVKTADPVKEPAE